jgi:hypothetical protein
LQKQASGKKWTGQNVPIVPYGMSVDVDIRSLELNIRQAILSDLAANAAKSVNHADVAPILDAVASKVRIIDSSNDDDRDGENRVYMVSTPLRVPTSLCTHHGDCSLLLECNVTLDTPNLL